MGTTEPDDAAAYLMATSPETLDLLCATAREMAELCGIGTAEAVARINHQWEGLDLSGEDELILHEDAYYWALRIYYRDVLDWRPEADRSAWTPRPGPPAGSKSWTV
ncbi:hypothetical protein [Streptomyces sp. NPDC001594]|uniref:hypothetical protein n=1 Tax=Streptomyces sp. NPDC001594 TaxID=3364590 RepID=UPI0036C3A5E2